MYQDTCKRMDSHMQKPKERTRSEHAVCCICTSMLARKRAGGRAT